MNCTRTQIVGVGMGNTEDNCMGERRGLGLYLNRGFDQRKRERESRFEFEIKPNFGKTHREDSMAYL